MGAIQANVSDRGRWGIKLRRFIAANFFCNKEQASRTNRVRQNGQVEERTTESIGKYLQANGYAFTYGTVPTLLISMIERKAIHATKSPVKLIKVWRIGSI